MTSGALLLARRFFPDRFEVSESGCWEWTAGTTQAGYGGVVIAGRTHNAHRALWEMTRGLVPDGLELDHLCRVRHCINPDHLEPVTRRENLMRSDLTLCAVNAAKTHCPQGHPYSPENTATYSGRRQCIACRTARNRARAIA